jgi:hypothetical protein
MKRFQLLVLVAFIAGVSPVELVFSVLPTQANQCSAEPPPNARSYWSYRLIDGRKCWYEGKPMLSKSLLEWPLAKKLPEPASESGPASDKASIIENPVVLNDNDGFEARWRARFLDAKGKY